ncbi:MAG: septum formation protein Maf [Clostridia bacterium]|nr:septum formation protein Maf [Clostridia bacterium]
MKIILASQSPRRKELLSRLYPEFEITVSAADEELPAGVHPREGVEILARRKGAAVLGMAHPCDVIISSDTLVELDGVPLGKPRDEEDAVRMLMSLSGKAHHVHTGVAVHHGGRVVSGVDTATVTFKPFSEREAREYVKTGEPMDKAGSYAIQGIGGALVSKFEGEFEVIVGLGLNLTKRLVESALSGEDDGVTPDE